MVCRWMMRRTLSLVVLSLLPVIAAAQSRGAVLSGRVLTDTTHVPIANAEVSIPELSIRGVTNEKGEFRLADIVPGNHHVRVRRLGYGALDARLDFAESQTVEQTIYLDRITLLDSMNVAARKGPPDPDLDEFAENRARGFGFFVTRAELGKQEGRSLAAVMSQTPGVGIIHGFGGQAWVSAKRSPTSQCGVRSTLRCYQQEGLYYLPMDFEKGQGMKMTCYARVFLDHMLMNPGQPTDPFDMNGIPVEQIESIEWYTGTTAAPPKYSSRNAACGIMVIHSRRPY